jgi:hypothetical protein
VSTRLALPAALLLFALSGCSPYLGVAERDFSQGRYLQAAEVLGAHEADVGALSPSGQAEYGLMRGLSLLVLGDAAGAVHWLAFAQRVDANTPGALSAAQRGALLRGLEDAARQADGSRYAAARPAGAPSRGAAIR